MLRGFLSRQLTFFANMAFLSNDIGGAEVPPILTASLQPKTSDETLKNDSDCGVVRLTSVAGDGEKVNDMLFCGNLVTGKEHVVYFGGDVQDFRENMLAHRDNGRYVSWSLEETAKLLSRRFPEGNIWVVKPAAMYLKTLSVFCNFVKTNGIGTPTFCANYGSVKHLEALLLNGMRRVEEICDSKLQGENQEPASDKRTQPLAQSEFDSGICKDSTRKPAISGGTEVSTPCSDFLPIRLIGFSKGSVVLNQILHEVHLIDTGEAIGQSISRIKAFYWLDGGHSGNSGTWITDIKVLQNLTKLKPELYVHVTPYQMDDSNRPWIAKEQKKFVSKLRSLGLTVSETRHFEDDIRSIETHFRVLEAF